MPNVIIVLIETTSNHFHRSGHSKYYNQVSVRRIRQARSARNILLTYFSVCEGNSMEVAGGPVWEAYGK